MEIKNSAVTKSPLNSYNTALVPWGNMSSVHFQTLLIWCFLTFFLFTFRTNLQNVLDWKGIDIFEIKRIWFKLVSNQNL